MRRPGPDSGDATARRTNPQTSSSKDHGGRSLRLHDRAGHVPCWELHSQATGESNLLPASQSRARIGQHCDEADPHGIASPYGAPDFCRRKRTLSPARTLDEFSDWGRSPRTAGGTTAQGSRITRGSTSPLHNLRIDRELSSHLLAGETKPGKQDLPAKNGGRYRIRTYDFHRVKMALYR